MLVLALSLATPLGLALYRAVGENLYSPRNPMASLPALCLQLGHLTTRLRAPVAAATAALLIGGTAIGGLRAVADDQRRPPWKQAAELLDSEATPGDGMLQLDIVASAAGGGALARSRRSASIGRNSYRRGRRNGCEARAAGGCSSRPTCHPVPR